MSLKVREAPFLRYGWLLRTWEPAQGTLCEVEGVALSLERAPPALPKGNTPAPPKAAAVQKADEHKFAWAVFKGALAVGAALDAMVNPSVRAQAARAAPPPPPPPPPPARPPAVVVPPFDIQDIPGAMRKMNMPMSAKLMERWFAGQLNYSLTAADEDKELDQTGQPYPPSMIDTTTIKMDWVLSFQRAKNAFDTLTESLMLATPKALDALATLLRPYNGRSATLWPWRQPNMDEQRRHKEFQFQHIDCNASWADRIAAQMYEHVTNDRVPDDLTGALGAFNFYAAVAEADFNPRTGTATVYRVEIYVKDHYTFGTSSGKASQYLGHWNKNKVSIQYPHAAAMALNEELSNNPVMLDKKISDVVYPVRNRDFRNWQMKHQRGGDFIIYSDSRFITLRRPIRVQL